MGALRERGKLDETTPLKSRVLQLGSLQNTELHRFQGRIGVGPLSMTVFEVAMKSTGYDEN